MAINVADFSIIFLPIVGILFLLVSLYFNRNIIQILKINKYQVRKFILVGILLLFFMLGYALLILINFNIITLPIDALIVVSFVYFFGAIFTVIALDSTKSILESILGKKISDEIAKKMFIAFTGIDPKVDLDLSYSFECEECKETINYTIPDVVRENAAMLDRGVSVESVFGVKSYILRPQHQCGKEGRREFTIIHDHELKVRSREKSRLLFKLE
ncbi:MAG: hypothetical protein INQ03_24845 [Candidatus Heimdallarchaeota archaeon]|nr:hypothetical protein [Candidatus Heimdallarchaeota archaeon]